MAVEAALETAAAALGALVPFTSPALAGVRVVAGSDGMLILRPAGDAATLVWDSLLDHPRITLHDRLLMRCLVNDAAGSPTPRAVVAAALAAALSGAAGRVARRAAAMTAQRQEEDRLIAQFLLVVRLLEEMGLEGMDWRHLSPSDPAFYDWLAASAARLAPALDPGTRDDGSMLADWIEELADAAAPVGLPGDEYAPATAQVIENLEALVDNFRDYAAAPRIDAASKETALRLAEHGARALTTAAQAVRECHEMLQDLSRLRLEWGVAGPQFKTCCAKLDWALDGWSAAGLIWSEATEGAARAAALREIERLLGLRPPAQPLAALLADPAAVDKTYRNELLKAAAT